MGSERGMVVLGIVVAVVVAYLVVLGAVVAYSWSWLGDRRAAAARHRQGQARAASIAVLGGGGVR